MMCRCLVLLLIVIENLSESTGGSGFTLVTSAYQDDTKTENPDPSLIMIEEEYSTLSEVDLLSSEFPRPSPSTEQLSISNLTKFSESTTLPGEVSTPTELSLEFSKEDTGKNNSSNEVQSDVKIFTTLLDLEEEYNMSFERMAEIFAEENKDINIEKKRRRKERDQERMNFFVNLKDDLVKSELADQEMKHKSKGMKSLALIVTPKGHTNSQVRGGNQYEKTSFLLSSDTEIDTSLFEAKSKSAELLELQEENFTNITHMAALLKNSPENTVYMLPPLTIELSEDSSLLLRPNERQEISFEVTNNLNNGIRVSFTVRDEIGILLEIDRYLAVLAPHTTITVRIAVLPKLGFSSDRITFIARGPEVVKKEVVADIEKDYREDDDAPLVDYTYTSDCTDVVLSKCKEGTWTIRITAKDTESGLKVFTTIPKGLYIPDGYTAGTREEITGIYSESCCNPDLQIIAIDRMNNRYIRQINAYRAPLSFWAVTAIILVSLVFLAIIVISSLICLKKCKKNETGSFDLPTYRGGRSRY